MRAADLPPDRSPDPSSATRRDAPGEAAGRARPPGELLDNLRLRLRELAGNHPSAVRAEGPGAAPRPAGDYARPASPQAGRPGDAQAGRPEDAPADDAPLDDIADEVDAEGTPADAADPQAPREGSLAELIRAIKDAGGALPGHADAGLLGEMDLFAGGGGDPYRPWFMSGEPLTPWFAAGEEPG